MTPAEYEKLSKNTNSLLFKNINEEFIVALNHILEDKLAIIFLNLQKRKEENEELSERQIRVERAEAEIRRDNWKSYTQPAVQALPDKEPILKDSASVNNAPLVNLDTLKPAMDILLNKEQKDMDKNGLADHYKALTTNYRDQISARLKPFIAIPINSEKEINLFVPKECSTRKVVTVNDVLNPKYNPELAKEKSADLVTHITLQVLGVNEVINKCKEIVDQNRDFLLDNGIHPDSGKLILQLSSEVNRAAKETLNEYPQLVKKVLENNFRQMGNNAAIAKLDTFFSPDTNRKLTSDERKEMAHAREEVRKTEDKGKEGVDDLEGAPRPKFK